MEAKLTITTEFYWSEGQKMEDTCVQYDGRGMLTTKSVHPANLKGAPFIGPIKPSVSSGEVSSTSDVTKDKFVGPPLLGLAPKLADAAKYIPPSLSNIPIQVAVRVGTMDMCVKGTMAIRLRETSEATDLNLIIQFWRGLSSTDPAANTFPSTDMDALIVFSCVQRALRYKLSFVADAFSELKNGKRKMSICGCLLATEITREEFDISMTQSSNFFYLSEWANVFKLFRPNTGFLKRLFRRFGNALFVNALIVDNNATHAINYEVTWKIYRELFDHAMNCAQLKGFHLALFIAKDKYEVIIFRSLGFKMIHCSLLDHVNEISLMIWCPALLL